MHDVNITSGFASCSNRLHSGDSSEAEKSLGSKKNIVLFVEN